MHSNHSLHLVRFRRHDLQGAAPTHRAPRTGRLRSSWFGTVRRAVPTRAARRPARPDPGIVGAPSPHGVGTPSC